MKNRSHLYEPRELTQEQKDYILSHSRMSSSAIARQIKVRKYRVKKYRELLAKAA